MKVCKLIKFFVVAFIVLLLISEGVSERKRKSNEKKKQKRRNQNSPEDCECGKANENGNDSKRIIDGDEVSPPNRFPWMISLSTTVKGHREQFCSGAVISPYAILTVAHCLTASTTRERHLKKCMDSEYRDKNCWKRPEEISVGFVTERKSVKHFGAVASWIKHPDFSIADHKSDIALIIMKDPIPCTANRPLCLPTKTNKARVGLNVTASGWGVSLLRAFPSTLKTGSLKIFDKEICKYLPGFSTIEQSVLCVFSDSDQAPCHGDSGSPITHKWGGTHYVLGIASLHSSTNCLGDMPSVYTDVYYYLPWIKENMNPNETTIL